MKSKVNLLKNIPGNVFQRAWQIVSLVLFLSVAATPLYAKECETFGFWQKCGPTYEHSTGKVYVGDFKNNHPNGRGAIQYTAKSNNKITIYDGEFVDGMRHGEGEAIYSNGDIYRGTWVAGVRNGEGLLKADGEHFIQKFEYGVLISSRLLINEKDRKHEHTKITPNNSGKDASSVQKNTETTVQPASTNKTDKNKSKDNKVSKSNLTVSFYLLFLVVIAILIILFLPKSKASKMAPGDLKHYSAEDEKMRLPVKNKKTAYGRAIKKAMNEAFENTFERKDTEFNELKASFLRGYDAKKMEKHIQKKNKTTEI